MFQWLTISIGNYLQSALNNCILFGFVLMFLYTQLYVRSYEMCAYEVLLPFWMDKVTFTDTKNYDIKTKLKQEKKKSNINFHNK